MPTPSGPVMKAWLPVASPGVPYHLPRVVDPGSGAIASTECAEIGHACAIRAGDEGMANAVVSVGIPYHLPRVVDPVSVALVSTECAEVGHACAIRAGDEGMELPVVSRGVPYHLPRVVDPDSEAIVSTECAKVGCFLAVKVNEYSMLLGERGRCEPNSQDCGQDKVAQCVAVVNVHQILRQRLRQG